MTKFFKKTVSLLAAAAMSLSVLTAPVSADSVSTAQVGALMDSYTAGSGTFTVASSSRIFVAGSTEPAGDLLQTAQLIQRQFKAELNYDIELVWGDISWAQTGDIVLVLDTSSGTGADGYKLDVDGTTAMVTAADVDGLIYGSNTLLKMFRAVGSNSLSEFSAADAPDTKERSVQLDVARKYYTVEWIKNFIRQMSWMGYNSLTLHFSEDGGFRADLWDPAYYKGEFQPENDFSWLCGSHVQSWVKDPYRTDPDAGEYLTTKELVEIINTAKEYHIELIPSFDSPAHMDYITWKFEQNYKSNNSYSFTYNGTTYQASSTSGCINYTGKTGDSSPTWPYYTTIDITDDTMAKAFVFALYEDIADFFKEYAGSTKFAIGADEVNLSTSNLDSGYSFKWGYSKFPGYINELNRMLNDKGYTCRMFNDFMGMSNFNLSQFDSSIEIMYWDSPFNPNSGSSSSSKSAVSAFVSDNRILYNCIQTHCYYVLRVGTSGSNRDARDPENRNWTFYHSTEEAIYNEWYPADISEKGDYSENAADVPADQLGGAYFLIWNDYAAVNTEEEVWNGAVDAWHKQNTYYLFDRMASNITKMWNSDVNSTVPYADFAKVRDAVNGTYFPGYTSCSKAASLPAATEKPEQAYLADHSELETVLAEGKITNDDGKYTAASYSAYETAYNTAVTVNGKHGATADEIQNAVTALNTAKSGLVDTTEAKTLLANLKAEGLYTAETYAEYKKAVDALESALAEGNATQAELDVLVAAVKAAEASLVETEIENDTAYIYTVKSASAAVKAGKKVVLIIETAPDITNLEVNGVDEPALCISSVQKIGGKDVKVWMLKFVAAQVGTQKYVITGTADTDMYTYTTGGIRVY